MRAVNVRCIADTRATCPDRHRPDQSTPNPLATATPHVLRRAARLAALARRFRRDTKDLLLRPSVNTQPQCLYP